MTGPNRSTIKRRVRNALSSLMRKPLINKMEKAEGPIGFHHARGVHPDAVKYLPHYGENFEVRVQTPYQKLPLYTATLTVAGETEPLLHTKVCSTPVATLMNLRIMIECSRDPLKDKIKQTLIDKQWEETCDYFTGGEDDVFR